MNISECIKCEGFPCQDIVKNSYMIPQVSIDPEKIRILMISEAPPNDKKDYFYSSESPFYLETTIQAFNDAGLDVTTMQEILDIGIYITTAVKCGKTQYSLATNTVKVCSTLLEKELRLFPNVEVYLLMGDIAIKSFNFISRRQIGMRVIPSGSSYKIRYQEFFFQDKKVIPSYLQTGKNYLIEKSKRRMIAEDIRAAMDFVN